jgi:transcriptional regulator with XRE-family HTH domain
MTRNDRIPPMPAQAFRAWRKDLGMSQAEAAERLGLKRRMVQYYERGTRDGRPVEVPRSVRLACWALGQGVLDFDGRAPVPAPVAGTE